MAVQPVGHVMASACGHRSVALPIFSSRAQRLAVGAACDGVTVGDICRLMPTAGRTLPNVFGIELGSDWRSPASMAEPNFIGQANRRCRYQTAIGAPACIPIQWRGNQHPRKTPVNDRGT